MLQLDNKTPFAAAIALFPNEQGLDTLYTIARATFIFFPQLTLAEHQPKPQQKDEYLGEPGQSSLLVPSDFHTGKLGTDILVTGSAVSPDRTPVRQMDVKLKVAHIDKTLRVFGDRFWDKGRISQPDTFSEMPLVYERAFGGTLWLGDQIHQLDERNPAGIGFGGDLTVADMHEWALPNVEHPQHIINHPQDKPEPANFGPIAPNWYPRRTYAGTYDDDWQFHRAPFLPLDYSPRFMNSAPSDQIAPAHLRGGEPVSIAGMHEDGDLQFILPCANLLARVDLGGRYVQAPCVLETVHLQPNLLQLNLVWRAAVVCGRQANKIRSIHLTMTR